MKAVELIRSLQNYEIVVNNRAEKKNKSIDFVSNTDESQSVLEDNEEGRSFE